MWPIMDATKLSADARSMPIESINYVFDFFTLRINVSCADFYLIRPITVSMCGVTITPQVNL